MSAHPVFRLDEIADVVAGDPAPQDPEAFAPDGPLFVRMQDVGSHHLNSALSASKDRLNSDWLAKRRLRLFPTDSILIPKSGASVNLNHRAKLATDAYVVSHLAVVIPNRTKVDPDYLFWWSVRYDPRDQAQVTSLPSLKLSTLKEAEISLPLLDEQRRIAGILNRTARIENLCAWVDKYLRDFVPALFVKMFGDPIENPMGWERGRLGDMSEVQGGLQVTRKRANHPLKKPYLRVANVLRDQLALSEIKCIRLTDNELDRVRLQRNDLLIVEGHGNPGEIGRAAIWDGSVKDCVHQNHLIRVRPDRASLIPEFACAYLNSTSGRQHLLRSGKTTSGLNTISTSDVKACALFVPPLDLQNRFAEVVAAARDIAATTESSLDTASTLSASVMTRLLGDGA